MYKWLTSSKLNHNNDYVKVRFHFTVKKVDEEEVAV